ncbi:MAG: glucosidase [Acidobacteriia bacterium]|nr:glucosidase [Terriglobia bacterium]
MEFGVCFRGSSVVTQEAKRLLESRQRRLHWKRWGPYLSERAWGTVREDYSREGTAWEYFPHDHARSRTYRWNEDGLAGLCDRRQFICIAFALWNEKDPILKERLFGLTAKEGNHGEDVKEYYFYLDSTPTHSYMRCLYKYPHAAFPYDQLVEENRRRSRYDLEYELMDTGVFNEDRYFDIYFEYAKAAPDDILIRVSIINHGPEAAPLHVLPTVWFRNVWSWGSGIRRPRLMQVPGPAATRVIDLEQEDYGHRRLFFEDDPPLLFTENETNNRRIFNTENNSPFVKDAFHEYLVGGKKDAVNPEHIGSKAAGHYVFHVEAGGEQTFRLRLTNGERIEAPFGKAFDSVMTLRRKEADEFYGSLASPKSSPENRRIQRQAFAGLLWNKQFYHYDVARWLRGDLQSEFDVPVERLHGRNRNWTHLYNADVISMPDKWEYPWYAAWDLAFHCIPLALVDPDFAKEQLVLLMREWFMHPNGQLPAYEWAFSDVNPPVHAWAAWRVYKIDRRLNGKADRPFLERVFHKLLLNFNWWVNRKDAEGMNVFEGGFMGLDNIGVFDRSAELPGGGRIEQSDTTSWMAMYCLNMLAIAMELARENTAYEDVASKFFEHFVYICRAMNNLGGRGIELWNAHDGFYYDVLTLPDGRNYQMKIRSMVGLIPLLAVETLQPGMVDHLPGFKRRLQWFLENRPDFSEFIDTASSSDGGLRRFLSLVNAERLRRVLAYMLDEKEFLSPFGIRALSRYHAEHPYTLELNAHRYQVDYEPAESTTALFGGNSNWRGPVWFPMNFLLIESLQKYHYFLGDEFKVECPTGSGHHLTLWEVAAEISRRLIWIFQPGPDGRRPVYGATDRFQHDPHWRDLILFYEYFHGDNGAGIGASHQTGWTALVAKLIQQSGS